MLRAFETFSPTAGQLAVTAVAVALAGFVLLRLTRGRPSGLVLREVGVVLALYALWVFLGAHTGAHATGAYDRAQDIQGAERDAHLNMEAWLQHGILGLPWLVRTANVFYATAHFPSMGLFLLWAFVRHRDTYGGARARVVLVTLICLLIEFVAVAPPRLLSGSGLVDTPMRYGQSVYSAGVAQVSAMPSVHIAWATLIAGEVLRLSRSRWRGLILLHPLVTLWVVMVTGNHWLFDGLAGAAIVALVEVALAVGARRRRVPPEPVPATAREPAMT